MRVFVCPARGVLQGTAVYNKIPACVMNDHADRALAEVPRRPLYRPLARPIRRPIRPNARRSLLPGGAVSPQEAKL